MNKNVEGGTTQYCCKLNASATDNKNMSELTTIFDDSFYNMLSISNISRVSIQQKLAKSKETMQRTLNKLVRQLLYKSYKNNVIKA